MGFSYASNHVSGHISGATSSTVIRVSLGSSLTAASTNVIKVNGTTVSVASVLSENRIEFTPGTALVNGEGDISIVPSGTITYYPESKCGE